MCTGPPEEFPIHDVKAVIADAYGTVLRIKQGCSPYKQILRLGKQQGRRVLPDDAEVIMINMLSLQGPADRFGISIPNYELSRIQGGA